MPGTLLEDVTTFYCFRRRKFAIKPLFVTFTVFILFIVTCSSTATEKVLLSFHRNSGNANAPRCYVIRTFPVLFRQIFRQVFCLISPYVLSILIDIVDP